MATRKRKSGGRRKTTRARKTTSTALARRRRSNPSRRTRRGSVVARSRRTARRRNPSGKLVPLAIGAAASQMVASFIPFGGSPFMDAGKIYVAGWLLEKFAGRLAPQVFGEARDGGAIAAVVTLLNAYVAPTLSGAVRSIMPGSGSSNGKGVSGIGRGVADLVTLPAGNYDPYYGTTPMISAPASGAQPVRSSQKAETLKGLLTMPAMPGAAYMR